MTAALAEPTDIITKTSRSEHQHGAGRGQPGQRPALRGPVTPEGKERSRRNGCKDGLTGKGIVLPPDAAAEVDRREAAFARDFRPRNAVERDLVRQMALGSWRREVLSIRIDQHDARMNAANFANWVEDQRLAAAGLGRRLADDPERAVIRLRRTSAGCGWLSGRWVLLGNGLSTAEEGGPGCTWTDADLALALDLLGLPAGLRHLDDRAVRLGSLRAEARSGSEGAVAELRELIAEEVAELEERDEEAWADIERPRLEGWRAGVEIDLGPEGERLHRYEMAADRLFRSAWTKLERLRKEHGLPLIPRRERLPDVEPAPRPPAPPPPAAARPASRPRHRCTRCRTSRGRRCWATRRPRCSTSGPPARPGPGPAPANVPSDKTNPAQGRPANGATPPKAGFPPAVRPGNRP